MTEKTIKCSCCGKSFLRSSRQINESKKFSWKTYCSKDCQSKAKNSQLFIKCSRPGCNNLFKRRRSEFKKSVLHFCSLSCAAVVNNSKFPKRLAKIKQCAYCGKEFKSLEKYCSKKCKDKDQVVTRDEITSWIKKFYSTNKRIPFKEEYSHSHAARLRFGTWNIAVKASGFRPNPLMFAKKYLANDGNKCDSLSEKIIDDWLYARKIKHKTNCPYPGQDRLTVDFKVGKFWIEFFGLSGQHKRYDELKLKKIDLAKRYNLKIIEIYPNDILPNSRLDIILQELLN